MSENIPDRIGSYDITREIGRGGMGCVYEGVQSSLLRKVAIKVLPTPLLGDSTAVERFNREAQAVAMLNHPNIVQIIDKAQEGDQIYFVMEYVDGLSLEELLRRRKLTLQEVFVVFKAVCSAIAYAHGKEIIHRDINPRNILVSDDLKVIKVVDFGISRVASVSMEQGTLSTVAAAMGTLHYIAPEQAANMLEADHRSDIYSLGVLLYSMLTGRVPIGSFNLPSRLNNEVPPEVDPIAIKCLATDPRERYQNMRQLVADLKAVEEKLHFRLVNELKGISKSTGNILRRSTQTIGRKSKILGIAAAVVVLAAVLAFAAWRLGSAWMNSSESGTVEEIASTGAEEKSTQGDASGQEAASAAGTDTKAQPERNPPPPASAAARSANRSPVRPPSGNSGASRQPSAGSAVPSTPSASSDEASPGTAADKELTVDLRVAREKLEAGLADQALADIDAILAEKGDQPDAAGAYLLRAQTQEALNQSDEAQASYVELESRFPKRPEAAEAKYRRARLILNSRRGSDMAARSVFGEVALEYPESAWAVPALTAKAEIEADKKIKEDDSELGTRIPAALLTYRWLVETYPTHRAAEGALWELGQMYEDLKKYELAADAFSQLGKRFPETSYDAWWKAGQIFERRLKDDARAKEAYQKVPSGSRRYNDAQKKTSRMNR